MKALRSIAAVSITGGVLAHVLAFMGLHIEPPGQPQPLPRPAEVRYLGHSDDSGNQAMLEQAGLFDSAPLFMPTRHNLASEMSAVAGLREATEIFDPFRPRLRLPDTTPAAPEPGRLDPPVPMPDGPAFILGRLGRAPAPDGIAVSPGPMVRIQRLDALPGAASTGLPVPAELAGLAPPVFWVPAQFLLLLAQGVPAGQPLLAQSSGFAEWDQSLRSFLGSLDFYRNLEDGYYRLTINP